MQKTLFLVVAFLGLITTAYYTPKSLAFDAPITATSTTSALAPTAIATEAAQNIPAPSVTPQDTTPSPVGDPQEPTRLIIPSIGLDDQIIAGGLTANGEMAVPSGSTQNVGWYQNGVIPGNPGSAVLDAHVFAAFTKLNQVKVGDSIYITDTQGTKRRCVVTQVSTYALADITSQMLFAPTNDRDLNLITCAGQLTPDHSTYDHRLVIYTTLAN